MTPEEELALAEAANIQNEQIPSDAVSEQSDEQQQLSDQSEPLQETISEILESFSKEHQDFNQDISKDLPEEVLNRIAIYLETRVAEDAKHQEKWINSINLIKPYLGLFLSNIFNKKSESSVFGNLTSSGIYDNTFATALLRLWATIRSEILPTQGPVGFKSIIDDTETSDMLGSVVKDALNEYLTVEDKGFYPDFDRFLLYLLLYGCIFRKLFIHPISKKPVTRFILPEDFLIENNCSSSFESKRQTHIRYLDKYEIISNMRQGIFRSNVQLNYLKANVNNISPEYNNVQTNFSNLNGSGANPVEDNRQENIDNYKFYETYEYLSINDFMQTTATYNFDIDNSTPPVPYIITRCATTNKIVSLIPNWKPEDETKKKIEHFIHYNLFPGFDIYGLGLGQILGSNAVTLTEIQRISIDAAIFQIFPGGFRAEGIKIQDNNLVIKPGQFIPLDTGTLPLQEALMPLPYQGPSPVLMQLAENMKASSAELASTAEMGMPEESANTPVGTTVAMLEVANRMQSAILKTIHNSFTDEIELLFSSFYSDQNLSKFSGFKVVPIADPSVESSTMRIMKAENLMKIASSAPELHDMRAVYERMYAALGIEDIESLLRPEQREEQSEQPQIDPALQVQMADTEQRKLEVESKERLAMLQMENDGYKTQMQIELDKVKLENDRYIADLKAREVEMNNALKMQIELMKLRETSAAEDAKLQIDLLKQEKDGRIEALEKVIEALQAEIAFSSKNITE